MDTENKDKPRAIDQITAKQKIFLHHYIQQGCNGARAYQAINPRCKQATAEVNASKLLSNTKVQAALTELCHEILDGDAATLKFIVRNELEVIGRSDLSNFMEWDQDGVYFYSSKGKDTRAVKSVRMKREIRTSKDGDTTETITMQMDMHDKNKALEQLAKILGLYSDGDVHNGDIIYVEAPLTDGWKGKQQAETRPQG